MILRKNILICLLKTSRLKTGFLPYDSILEYRGKTHNNIKIGKEVLKIIVVDTLLHSLTLLHLL